MNKCSSEPTGWPYPVRWFDANRSSQLNGIRYCDFAISRLSVVVIHSVHFVYVGNSGTHSNRSSNHIYNQQAVRIIFYGNLF